MTSLVTPSGQTITYTYSNHRISSVSVNGTTLLNDVTYAPFGSATGWTWGNSTTDDRTYSLDGYVASITSAGDAIDFAYDNASRISSITDTQTNTYTWTFGYDGLDRLTSGSSVGNGSHGWTYDANGNMLTQSESQATTYNISSSNNRVTSSPGPTPTRWLTMRPEIPPATPT